MMEDNTTGEHLVSGHEVSQNERKNKTTSAEAEPEKPPRNTSSSCDSVDNGRSGKTATPAYASLQNAASPNLVYSTSPFPVDRNAYCSGWL